MWWSMRSRANTLRVAIERAMRALVLVVLAFAAWSASRTAEEREPMTGSSQGLATSLAEWTASAPPAAHIAFDVAPTGRDRDWLRALGRAGSSITWSGDSIPSLAVESAPIAGPRGGWTISVAAPAGARVAIDDAIAPIDTIETTAGGAHVVAPIGAGYLAATVGGHTAVARPRDTLLPRRVL